MITDGPPQGFTVSVAELEALVGPVHPQSDTAWEYKRELETENRLRQEDDAYLRWLDR